MDHVLLGDTSFPRAGTLNVSKAKWAKIPNVVHIDDDYDEKDEKTN